MQQKHLLLIDGDISIYKVSAATQRSISWDGEDTCIYGDIDVAFENICQWFEDLKNKFNADKYIVALSDGEYFRYNILPTYKGNRSDILPPVVRDELKSKLKELPEAKFKDGLEGDDILGILATSKKLYKDYYKIVLSDDKDLKTIPCNLYNTRDKLREITQEEADRFHLMQTLTGDITDGYRGCPGIGIAKAAKLLANIPYDETFISTAWATIVEAYESKGLSEDDALVQAQVARILRAEDYNFKTKSPILWTPK